MYVHGFGSSAQSGTVQMLRTLMPNATVVARDIPLHPEEGLQMLKAMAAEEQPDLIIGTSMGGMYTEMLTGFDRILVNPAFEMGDTMSKFTGKQVFQNPREDGVQEFIVTKGLIKEYQEMTTHNFEHAADPEERTRVIGLFGDNDPVVHTYDLFHEHYPTAIGFHGEHRLTDKVAMHYLIPVIRYIDDRQEGRERPSSTSTSRRCATLTATPRHLCTRLTRCSSSTTTCTYLRRRHPTMRSRCSMIRSGWSSF